MRQEARSQLAATKASDSQAARRGGELGGGLGGASPSLLLPTAGLSAGLGSMGKVTIWQCPSSARASRLQRRPFHCL